MTDSNTPEAGGTPDPNTGAPVDDYLETKTDDQFIAAVAKASIAAALAGGDGILVCSYGIVQRLSTLAAEENGVARWSKAIDDAAVEAGLPDAEGLTLTMVVDLGNGLAATINQSGEMIVAPIDLLIQDILRKQGPDPS